MKAISGVGRFFDTVKTRSSSWVAQFMLVTTAVMVGLGQPQKVSAQTPPSQLLNISARLPVLGGDNVLIGGFIVTGTVPKRVIVRGIGPSLSRYFPAPLSDPTLELYAGSVLLASNDNWGEPPDPAIEASTLAPTNPLESVIMRTLAPGAYTAVLRGKAGAGGIGVVEVYDLDNSVDARLANLSTRGFVDTNDNVLIAGVIIGPSTGRTLDITVRAIGPSLSQFGVPNSLQNPTLDLVNSNGVVVHTNDNWKDSQANAIVAAGLQPTDDRESALIETLQPGNYTAIVRGVGGTTGVGLVEVYSLGATLTPPVPDPVIQAPPPPADKVPSFDDQTSFLYKSANPVQRDVPPGTIRSTAAAVIRGIVKRRDEQPLAGVRITVHGHPEFGYTLSRANGQYDVALNGGRVEQVDFVAEGYLPAQRQVQVSQQDFALAAEVIMIPVDGIGTTVSFGVNAPAQVANSSPKTDAAGSRSATMYFPAGVGAQLLYSNGTTQSVDRLTVRATEYTVGPNGPAAMPATLPGTSAYTYCVALTGDEAINAGAKSIVFDKDVPVYVDNYLGLPVGALVPSGFYDRDKAAWVPAENGIVAKVLSVSNGAADLDLDGNGVAENDETLASFGITAAERQQIAAKFAVGATFWRMPVTHFTDWDYNFPPTTDDKDSPPENQPEPSSPDAVRPGFGELGLASQVFTEQLPIAGTAMSLHYASDRVLGYKVNATLNIPLIGDTLPNNLTGTDVVVEIAGRTLKQSFPPQTNLVASFQWDGRDFYEAGSSSSDPIAGSATAHATLAYRYPLQYAYTAFRGTASGRNYVARDSINPSNTSAISIGSLVPLFGLAGTQPSAVVHSAIEDAILTRFDRTLTVPDQRKAGMNGWSLTPHHFYDPTAKVLYRGDGRQIKAEATGRTVDFVYRALSPRLNFTTVAVRPNGDVYVSDIFYQSSHIYKITPSGQFLGVTSPTSTGGIEISSNDPKLDGKLAADVFVSGIIDQMKAGPDGSIYVAYGRTIWRLDQDDRFHLVLCGGASPAEFGVSAPDGTSADRAYRNYDLTNPGKAPNNIAIAKDGSVYFSDSAPNPNGDYNHPLNTIRKIAPDGRIYTVAGLGGIPDFPDIQYAGNVDMGKPALTARLYTPTSIAVGPDDSLYYTSGKFGIVHIKKNGILELVLYGGLSSPAGLPDANDSDTDEGKLAVTAGHPFGQSFSLNVTPDGVLHFRTIAAGVYVSNTIWSIAPDGILRRDAGRYFAPALQTGNALQADIGQHLLDFNFGPDGKMYLVSDEQNDGLHSIRKISSALPGFSASELTFASEDGQEFYIFDQNGRHLRTIDPLLNITLWTFSYDSKGFVTSLRDRDGLVTAIERDGAGHATTIVGPYGARTALAVDSNGYLASVIAPDQTKTQITNSSMGLLSSITGPRQDTYSFTYDDMGRLTRGNQPGGGFTTLARTGSDTDATVTATRAGGRVETRRIQRTPVGGTLTTLTGPNELPSSENRLPDGSKILNVLPTFKEESALAPDPRSEVAGQGSYPSLLRFTTPSGLKTEVNSKKEATFSDASNPLSLASFVATTSINGNSFTESLDLSSRVFTLKSPEQRQVTLHLNAAGRPSNRTLGNLASESFSYDDLGRLTTLTTGVGADARTITTGYDANGYVNVLRAPDGRQAKITNDAFGQPTSIVLPGDRNLGFTFGVDGRLESVTPPSRPSYAFLYDVGSGRVTYKAPPLPGVDNTTVFEQDIDRQFKCLTLPGGRRLDLARFLSGKISSITNTFGDTFNYNYNSSGQLSGISQPSGLAVAFTYLGLSVSNVTLSGAMTGSLARQFNNELSISSEAVNGETPISFGYDRDGLMISAGALAITWRSDIGLPVSTKMGNVTTSSDYDAFGYPTRRTGSYNDSSLFDISETRDSTGRVITRVSGGSTSSYSYDAAGFLASTITNGAPVASYSYDANGNVVQAVTPAGPTSYTYDAQDRLLTAGTSNFSYTDAGELKARITPSGTTSYSYDEFGQLRHVSLPDGRNIDYLLGAPGGRTAKKINGRVVQAFLHDEKGSILAELDGSNAVVSRFVYSVDSATPAYIVHGSDTLRIVTDSLGSVRLVVNAQTGAVIQRIEYDEWGQVSSDSNPGFQPFGFAGGLFDRDTNLVRFGARDYDPGIRRWTAPDPIRFAGGSTNLYAYVENDPINHSDRSGTGPTEQRLRALRATRNAAALDANIETDKANINGSWARSFGTVAAVFSVPVAVYGFGVTVAASAPAFAAGTVSNGAALLYTGFVANGGVAIAGYSANVALTATGSSTVPTSLPQVFLPPKLAAIADAVISLGGGGVNNNVIDIGNAATSIITGGFEAQEFSVPRRSAY